MTTNRHTTLCAVGLMTAALALSACVQEKVEYDWDSGGDHLRDRSKKLFVGQRVTDSLNAPLGDHTDWKEIRIRESGTMSVTVSIDNTSAMNGHVSIKDGFGVELERRPLNASDNIYTFDRIPVYQGDYYVHVFAKKGDSVYTAGATFDPLPKSGIAYVPDETGPSTAGRRNTGGGRKTTLTGETGTTSVAAKADEITPDGPDATDPGDALSLRGRIVRVIPQEDGGAQLTIVGMGSADGLATGMTGTIIGFGKTFRVTSVSKRGASAVTNAEAEEVKAYHNVVVKVR